MTDVNMIEAVRSEIVLLGKELEFASGIRAVAAEQALESGISDPDGLYEELENAICIADLFESYKDPLDDQEGELVLGEGVPFPSLEAYIALRTHYGQEWLLLAMTDYCTHFGSVELRSDPAQFAKDFLGRAGDNLAHAEKPAPSEALLHEAIIALGREFEEFDGVRPLAAASHFHEEDPVDDPLLIKAFAALSIGSDLVEKGFDDPEKIEEVFDCFYRLRMHYGHGCWIQAGLQCYLMEMMGMEEQDAATKATKMTQAAASLFSSLDADYEVRRKAGLAQHLLEQIAMYEQLLADSRSKLKDLEAA